MVVEEAQAASFANAPQQCPDVLISRPLAKCYSLHLFSYVLLSHLTCLLLSFSRPGPVSSFSTADAVFYKVILVALVGALRTAAAT